jgi:hypothetical protein
MKVLYLASFQASHPRFDVTYQDINGKRDIGGDMMEVDLAPYDVIIATPPCNYYSKLNRSRETSIYAQSTKHLLPSIIDKLSKQNKPYLVENVRSHIINSLIKSMDFNGFIVQYGRHTYWTNVPFNPFNIKQNIDFKSNISRKSVSKEDFPKLCSAVSMATNPQGGQNVHNVIDYWLDVVKATFFEQTDLRHSNALLQNIFCPKRGKEKE